MRIKEWKGWNNWPNVTIIALAMVIGASIGVGVSLNAHESIFEAISDITSSTKKTVPKSETSKQPSSKTSTEQSGSATPITSAKTWPKTCPVASFKLVSISPSSTNLSASKTSGKKGVVMEKLATGCYGKRVKGVKVVFKSEDGSIQQEVISDSNGGYKIGLPTARYKVTASHSNYKTYSTGGGFFVIGSRGFGTGNIFMLPKGGLDCPPEGNFPPFHKQDPETLSDAPPKVSMSVSKSKVRIGEDFVVTVSANDDVALSNIWWYGFQTGDYNLDIAHMVSCGEAKSCSNTWKISSEITGRLVLGANARDTAEPTKQQAEIGEGSACTEIVVSN